MKWLFALIFIPMLFSNGDFNAEKCSCDGKTLAGNVRVVESGEDFKVRVVESGEQLRVTLKSYRSDECGKWRFVESGEDFTIRFVNSGEDFSIRFTDY